MKEINLSSRDTKIREDIISFIKDLKKDKFFMKNIDSFWISGADTYVYPIAVYKDEIVFQWKSSKNCPIFLYELSKKYSDIISSGRVSKTDGSCPNRLIFKLSHSFETRGYYMYYYVKDLKEV